MCFMKTSKHNEMQLVRPGQMFKPKWAAHSITPVICVTYSNSISNIVEPKREQYLIWKITKV